MSRVPPEQRCTPQQPTLRRIQQGKRGRGLCGQGRNQRDHRRSVDVAEWRLAAAAEFGSDRAPICRPIASHMASSVQALSASPTGCAGSNQTRGQGTDSRRPGHAAGAHRSSSALEHERLPIPRRVRQVALTVREATRHSIAGVPSHPRGAVVPELVLSTRLHGSRTVGDFLSGVPCSTSRP